MGSGQYKVAAAMYVLDSQHTMTNIPADLAWLPGWHSHNDELCNNADGSFAGFQGPIGVCSSGQPNNTPPMMHVWIIDNECGHRFAGIGLMGIDCGEHGAHEPIGTPGTVPVDTRPHGTMPLPVPVPPGPTTVVTTATPGGTTPTTVAVRPATAVRATPTFTG